MTDPELFIEIEIPKEVVDESGYAWLKLKLPKLDDGSEPPPPPPPPDPDPQKSVFKITSSKSLAHFVYDYNNAGKPIMMIYPTEADKDVDKRVKFTKDQEVLVYPEAIRADGGKDFYEIVDSLVPDAILYLNEDTGVLL